MSVHGPPQSAGSYTGDFAKDRGAGWVAFAGVLFLILGTVNVIEGIAAIGNAHFFIGNVRYVFGDLNT